MKPTIPFEIRGRRLVDGALVDQHVATGFGHDAKSAIRWARYNEPAKTSSFPDADLYAVPDPINLAGLTNHHGDKDRWQATPAAGSTFPIRHALLASIVVLAFVSVAADGESISVASGIDRKRPHRSEPSLSPDSLGAQSERAVSHGWSSSPAGTSPTENLFPTPAGSLVGLSADLLSGTHSTGVGNSITPAVGVNLKDHSAQPRLQQETDEATTDAGVIATQESSRSVAAKVTGSGTSATPGPVTHFDRDFWAGISAVVLGLGTLAIGKNYLTPPQA